MRPRTRPSLRQRLDELFQPYAGDLTQPRGSLWLDLFIVGSILASCVAIAIEHLADAETNPGLHHAMLVAEAVFTVVFSVEYVLRWYASQNRLRHPFTLFAIIDLLAILPSVLMFAHILGGGAEFLALRAVRVLRVLRLLRLLRLLKVFRHGYAMYRLLVSIRIWVSAIIYHYHLERLARLLLITVVAWVAGSNALYISEALSSDGAEDVGYAVKYGRNYWGVLIFLISGMDAEEPLSLTARVIVTALLLIGTCLVAVFTGEVVSILVLSQHRRGKMRLKPPGLKLAEHVVILGRNEHLEQLIQQINAALGGKHYILVACEGAESIPATGSDADRRCFVVDGDPSRDDVLDAANIEAARRVIVLADQRHRDSHSHQDNVSLMHALASIARHREVPLVVELQEPESLRYAESITSADCLVSRHFGEKLMSQAVLNPGVTTIYDELMNFSGQSNEFYRVVIPGDLVGKTFREVQEYFLDHDEEVILPVGVESGSAKRAYTAFELCVAGEGGEASLKDYVLTGRDRLIVIAYERPSFDTSKPEEAWQGNELPRR